MPLYDPRWTDMSDHVVHFTKPGPQGKPSAYDNAMGILCHGTIQARSPFGMSKQAPNPDAWKAVCFSEVPLHLLSRLAQRRGRYGLGFRKDLVLGRGGGPVFYAPLGSPHQAALKAISSRAFSSPQAADDPFWRVAPFVDSPGDYPGGSYRFEWEREWRHVGDFRFEAAEVAFLIIPEADHQAARAFFEDAQEERLGPGYLCPYIDPYWSEGQVSAALSAEGR